MTFLSWFKNIPIGLIENLYSNGYKLIFHYDKKYLEIYVPIEKEKEFKAIASI